MSDPFDYDHKPSLEKTVQSLENDIQRYRKACLSEWPRPMDYTNLIDAQHALKALKGPTVDSFASK